MSYDIADAKQQRTSVLFADLDEDRKREVLDLSTELTQFRFSKRKLEKESVREAVSSASSPPAVPSARPRRTPIPPRCRYGRDEGHGRPLPLGGGYRTTSGSKSSSGGPPTTSWRTSTRATCGRADQLHGYFVPVLRRGRKARLHRWRIVDIVSLFPWNNIFKPVSWKVLFGVDELLLRDGREHPVPRLNAGGGVTLARGQCAFYLFGEGDLQASTRWISYMPSASAARRDDREHREGLEGEPLDAGALLRRRRRAPQRVAGLQQNFASRRTPSISLDAQRERSYNIYKTTSRRLNVCY